MLPPAVRTAHTEQVASRPVHQPHRRRPCLGRWPLRCGRGTSSPSAHRREVQQRISDLRGMSFPSAKYHPNQSCPLFHTSNTYILWGRVDNQRMSIYIRINPESSVESISEVPRASKSSSTGNKWANHLKALTGVVHPSSLFPLF